MLNGDRHSVEALIGKPLRKANSDSASYECVAKDVSRKRKDGGRVPRPPNAFILYRSETQPKLVEKYKGTGKSSRDFSAMVGQMWREESPETRKRFSELAAERLSQHRSRYPEYKYTPKKPNGASPSQTKPKTAVRTSTKPKPRAMRRRRVLSDDSDSDDDGDASFHEGDESDFEGSSSSSERGYEHPDLLGGTKYSNPMIVPSVAEAAEPVEQHAVVSLITIKAGLHECGVDSVNAASHTSSRSSSFSPRAEPLSTPRALSTSGFTLPDRNMRVSDSTSNSDPLDVQRRASGAMESAPFAVHPAFTATPQHTLPASFHGSTSFSHFPMAFDFSTFMAHARESNCLYTGSSPSFASTTSSLLEQYVQNSMEPGMKMFRANEGQGPVTGSNPDHHPCFISMQDIFPQPLPDCTTSLLSTLPYSGHFALPPGSSSFLNVPGLKLEMQGPVYHAREYANFNQSASGHSALAYVGPAVTNEVALSVDKAQSVWLTGAKTLTLPIEMNGSGDNDSLAATSTPEDVHRTDVTSERMKSSRERLSEKTHP